jgi:protein SCO1/2
MDASTPAAVPVRIGGPFDLVDDRGRPVTERDYLGKVVLMLFGFTRCRVVCPRSLRKLSAVLDALGTRADGLTALYVSVDPERDDPETMHVFLQDYPRFVGLTGSRAQVDRVMDAYRVYARRREADTGIDDDYAIAHTSLAYLLDRQGAYATHFPLVLEEHELVERVAAVLG